MNDRSALFSRTRAFPPWCVQTKTSLNKRHRQRRFYPTPSTSGGVVFDPPEGGTCPQVEWAVHPKVTSSGRAARAQLYLGAGCHIYLGFGVEREGLHVVQVALSGVVGIRFNRPVPSGGRVRRGLEQRWKQSALIRHWKRRLGRKRYNSDCFLRKTWRLAKKRNDSDFILRKTCRRS